MQVTLKKKLKRWIQSAASKTAQIELTVHSIKDGLFVLADSMEVVTQLKFLTKDHSNIEEFYLLENSALVS